MSDASSIAASTDIDESSGVTEDESYDDYVGANPEENDEDGDLGTDNDGDDGGDDVSLQGKNLTVRYHNG